MHSAQRQNVFIPQLKAVRLLAQQTATTCSGRELCDSPRALPAILSCWYQSGQTSWLARGMTSLATRTPAGLRLPSLKNFKPEQRRSDALGSSSKHLVMLEPSPQAKPHHSCALVTSREVKSVRGIGSPDAVMADLYASRSADSSTCSLQGQHWNRFACLAQKTAHAVHWDLLGIGIHAICCT